MTILDEDAWHGRTDNIVIVEPKRKRLLWIPRDLWCNKINNRVNVAFRRGGHDLLMRSLNEYGFNLISRICFKRSSIAIIFRDPRVWVPVKQVMKFRYPLEPMRPIGDGRKLVTFEPPSEFLSGKRIHQWLGARITPDGTGTDLDRIDRQKIFLRRLLEQQFNFIELIEDSEDFSVSGAGAIDDIRKVGLDWRFETSGPLEDATIERRRVLIKQRRIAPLRSSRRLKSAILQLFTHHG